MTLQSSPKPLCLVTIRVTLHFQAIVLGINLLHLHVEIAIRTMEKYFNFREVVSTVLAIITEIILVLQ